MKRSNFRPYVMRHCSTCNGDQPHTAKGSCVACKKRETATPGRQLYQRARALQRTKKAASKPMVSPTKQAAKAALPIAQGIVKRRAKGLCEICGNRALVSHCHHRKPRGAGGSSSPTINTASNLLHVHPECHEAVESFRSRSYQQGLLVFQSADPAKVPVLLHSGWHLLADDGSMTRVNPPETEVS